MKKTFNIGKIDVRTPIELVHWIIKHVKAKNMDKAFSGLGSIAVSPPEAVELAKSAKLADYCTGTKRDWSDLGSTSKYEISFDPCFMGSQEKAKRNLRQYC